MRRRNFFLIVLAGIFGYIAGILYAPDKGENTMKKLKKNADYLKTEVKEKIDDAKDTLHLKQDETEDRKAELIQNAKKEITQILDKIEDAAANAKENVEKSDKGRL